MGSVPRMTKPYRAAMKGKWSEVKSFYEEHIELVGTFLTGTGDTALHVAVRCGDRDGGLLHFLLQILERNREFLPFQIEEFSPFQITDNYGNTALHAAAAIGNLEAAKLLLSYDEKLLPLQNDRGETALFSAAAFGRTKVVNFLARKVQVKEAPYVRRNDSTSILHIAILGRYFETAVELLNLGVAPDMIDEDGMTGFQQLATMSSAFKSGYRMGKLKALIYYCLPEVAYADNDKEEIESGQQVTVGEKNQDLEKGHVSPQKSGFPSIKTMWRDKQQQTKALELAKILAETDRSWQDRSSDGASNDKISTNTDDNEDGDGEEKKEPKEEDDNSFQPAEDSEHRDTPLIVAARNGILEIVEAILKVYPQAIEHENHKNENIFHVVAKYRRTEILDFLLSPAVVVPKSRLWRKINSVGDSILHNAAYLGDFSSRDRPGEALQMQSEIQWFKRVQKIVPVYFINHRNKDKKTAHELFTKQHEQLVQNGQEWLMRTTQACTLVAVLIATVAFTCAYTVPGGSNNAGHPLLLKTTPFSVFATSDALSLCFSLTSVVVFLSIMTSTMREQDFKRSLPLKLVLGLTTLFFSVTAMMVSFSATLVLMTRQRLHSAAIPIYTVACCPVTIFLILQLPLYLNIAWFTLKDLFAG